MSECITTVVPGLEAAHQAGHETVQSKCSDCSFTDPLPLGSGRLVPARHDTPAGNPPVETNICNTPDNLQIEMEWMERFIMSPQVLCLDGLASDDDHEDRSSDVGDEAGVLQDPMTTVVSV